MTVQVRRVVTGHDETGKAVVRVDEVVSNLRSSRPGLSSGLVWSTESTTPDNNDETDGGLRKLSGPLPDGTIFRVVKYEPGATPRRHRTDSLDYAVVMSGEIDMELDGGETVTLRAGDVVVQRGTIHNWLNRGTEPCVIAFVLIGAPPVKAAGKVLEATG